MPFANVCPVKRSHAAAVAALVVLAVPALAGCFNGLAATTTVQASQNSGNGVEANVGPLHVDGTTLVMADDAPNATLTMRVSNTGVEDDTLVAATINGAPAYITAGAGTVPAGSSVSFGFESDAWVNAYGLDVPVSTYVPVRLVFEKAGPLDLSVLTVPRAGYYVDVAPNPPTNPSPAAS